jgi:hypothetical protein
MRQDREHPLYYLDAETLLVAIYVWVDDELKALQAQGFKLPKKQRHQKATLAELLTLAIFLLLQGQDLAKGYLAAKTTRSCKDLCVRGLCLIGGHTFGRGGAPWTRIPCGSC